MATNFPVTLAGTYSDGSLCKGSDYLTDFTTLKDAVNQLYERYASFSFSGDFSQTVGPNDAMEGVSSIGAETEFHVLGNTNDTHRHVFAIFYVPVWMQGLRVRELMVLNHSVHLGSGTPTALTSVAGAGLVFGAAYGDTLTDFSQTSTTNWTDISQAVFNTAAEVNGSVSGDSTHVNGYLIRNSVNAVVPPGNYVVFWTAGSVTFASRNYATPSISHWKFSANILCDTMVPIP